MIAPLYPTKSYCGPSCLLSSNIQYLNRVFLGTVDLAVNPLLPRVFVLLELSNIALVVIRGTRHAHLTFLEVVLDSKLQLQFSK